MLNTSEICYQAAELYKGQFCARCRWVYLRSDAKTVLLF